MSEAHALSLLKRGIANARAGEKALARRLLQRSAELNPDNDAVWLWLAVTATNDDDKIDFLHRALAINPNNERVKATLKQIESKMSKQAPAWKCPLCMAPASRPQQKCPTCHAVLGLEKIDEVVNSNADQTKMKRAISGYKNVLGQGVDFGAHYNMALAHLNSGELDQGIAHLQGALRLEPNDSTLKAKIEELVAFQATLKKGKAAGGASSAATGWVRGTILVVDDSPTIRKLVGMTLKRYDYEVVTAEDGMEALGKLNYIDPALVLLDITMPRMDGYQVCKIIKNNRETRHIPVIMLSGKDGFFDKVRGRLAGSNVYITKPFDPNVLLQVVEKHALASEKTPVAAGV